MRGWVATWLVRFAVWLLSKGEPHEVYLNMKAQSYKGRRFAFLAARTSDFRTAISFPKEDDSKGWPPQGYLAVPEWVARVAGWNISRPYDEVFHREAEAEARVTEARR